MSACTCSSHNMCISLPWDQTTFRLLPKLKSPKLIFPLPDLPNNCNAHQIISCYIALLHGSKLYRPANLNIVSELHWVYYSLLQLVQTSLHQPMEMSHMIMALVGAIHSVLWQTTVVTLATLLLVRAPAFVVSLVYGVVMHQFAKVSYVLAWLCISVYRRKISAHIILCIIINMQQIVQSSIQYQMEWLCSAPGPLQWDQLVLWPRTVVTMDLCLPLTVEFPQECARQMASGVDQYLPVMVITVAHDLWLKYYNIIYSPYSTMPRPKYTQ